MRIFLTVLFTLTAAAVQAQIDTALIIQADTLTAAPADTLDTLDGQQLTPDTVQVIDNSSTVDLILHSQSEDITTSLKENLLIEQLDALSPADRRQRQLVERQLEQLKTEDSIRRGEQQKLIDSLKNHASGAAVMLNRDTLFLIYTNLASFSPNERAQVDSERILKAAKLFSVKQDSLLIVDGTTSTDIMYRDMVLASVTELDALWIDTTRQELAQMYSQQITDAIIVYKKNVSVMNILKMIGLSILILLIQFGLIKGVTLLFRRVIDQKLIARKDKWFNGIRIRNLEVMDQERELRAVLFVSKMLRYLLYIILLYITIPLLFSVFPPTQRLAETLFSWIFSPLASLWKNFIHYLPNLFQIIIIVVIFRYIVKFFRYISREIYSGRLAIPGFYPDWAKATFNILRIFLYAFMVILVFPLLPGSDSGIFQGVSVFIGVLFTLGSTSVIGNLMAGMVITYMRPFVVGDRIRIGEVSGDVTEKSPFVIRIKTVKNEVITVPNATVLSANVINYSSPATFQSGGLIVNTTVTMGYDVAWRQVNELLIEAALKTDLILSTPQPFVLQTELNDFSASYQLNAYTKDPHKQAVIYSQLHQNIQDIFMEAGIELINPNYQAIRDGNKSTIPEDMKKE